MKFIGDFKKKAEDSQTKEETRDFTKEVGMLLDDELDQVSGGYGEEGNYEYVDRDSECKVKKTHHWINMGMGRIGGFTEYSCRYCDCRYIAMIPDGFR